ncbi:MAG: hypothetical protein KAI79_19590 [Bacteroidales bacterium]|nr:hypothetical protein [Bacteroidales bacterium]
MNNNSNIFISSTNENQMQTESEIIESKNSTSLISKTRISKHLSSGETWKFENGYMSNISDIGIEIIGSVGTNQTVIIKASKFTNIKLPLRILYVDNVIIEGNYFQDMWSGIHVAYAKNITVRYNKFERHGVKPGRSNTSWAGNFLHLNSCNLDTLSIEHNLVDRSSDSRPNKQENTFAEDHLSIYHTKMVGGNK